MADSCSVGAAACNGSPGGSPRTAEPGATSRACDASRDPPAMAWPSRGTACATAAAAAATELLAVPLDERRRRGRSLVNEPRCTRGTGVVLRVTRVDTPLGVDILKRVDVSESSKPTQI